MKIIEFQTELQRAHKEGLTELLERIKNETIDGFIVLVKTRNQDTPYIQASSHVGFELIGLMETTKVEMVRRLYNPEEEDDGC